MDLKIKLPLARLRYVAGMSGKRYTKRRKVNLQVGRLPKSLLL